MITCADILTFQEPVFPDLASPAAWYPAGVCDRGPGTGSEAGDDGKKTAGPGFWWLPGPRGRGKPGQGEPKPIQSVAERGEWSTVESSYLSVSNSGYIDYVDIMTFSLIPLF